MAKKRLPFDTTDAKEFAKEFEKLSYRFNTWEVWCDFVTSFACCISLTADRSDQGRFEDRSKRLNDTMKRYTEEERRVFTALAEITASALEKNPEQDFLGRMYMSLDFGSKWHGQFFTPWDVGYAMAKMTLTGNDAESKFKEQLYLSCMDPCCGAGCLLLASAAAYDHLYEGRRHQDDLLLVGQDLDPTVAMMCYIQLSLTGCAGYIAVGNSLTNPVAGTVLDPEMDGIENLWFTPMWFSPLWEFRRISHLLRKMEWQMAQQENEERRSG